MPRRRERETQSSFLREVDDTSSLKHLARVPFFQTDFLLKGRPWFVALASGQSNENIVVLETAGYHLCAYRSFAAVGAS